jgi:hypothetical protein
VRGEVRERGVHVGRDGALAFLDDPGAPLDRSCVDAMPPVEFAPPDAQPTW